MDRPHGHFGVSPGLLSLVLLAACATLLGIAGPTHADDTSEAALRRLPATAAQAPNLGVSTGRAVSPPPLVTVPVGQAYLFPAGARPSAGDPRVLSANRPSGTPHKNGNGSAIAPPAAGPGLREPNLGDMDPAIKRGPVPPNPPESTTGPPPVRGPIDWQEPTALAERLGELAEQEPTRAWASKTAALIERLGAAAQTAPREAGPILDRLAELEASADPLCESLADESLACDVRRAAYALTRRLGPWRAILSDGVLPASAPDEPQGDPARLALALAKVDSLLGDSEAGESWRRYLALEAIRSWVDGPGRGESPPPPPTATEVLGHLVHEAMTPEQRRFVARGEVRALHAELWAAVAPRVDAAILLRDVERFEETGLPADAARLAADLASLRFSPHQPQRDLARMMERYYRNANLRLTVHRDLIERLLPEKEPEDAPVREVILGVPVRGRSRIWTQMEVVLVPDDSRIRVELDITGEVSSLTRSSSGPATFFNKGYTMYTARKPLLFDLNGIRTGESEVEVYSQTQLRSLSTRFDGLPVLGGLARGMAFSAHERRKPQFDQEVRRKVARQARQRVDEETQPRFEEASRRWRERVIGPLDELDLKPALIDAATDEDGIALRLRLAGDDQLGGHTPRPRTPPGSLASVQLHQSALNNYLARLELAGRRFTLPELSEHLAEQLGREEGVLRTGPDLDDVEITFADEDPVVVRLSGGRLIVTLSVARLKRGGKSWSDFQARAIYKPQVDGPTAELVRDGVVRLIGGRLGVAGQIALRGVFTQVFSRRRSIPLTPEALTERPELADLVIGRLTIDDGWLAMAWSQQQWGQSALSH